MVSDQSLRILAIHNFYRIRSGEDLAFEGTVSALRESGHVVEVISRNNKDLNIFSLLLNLFFSFSIFFKTILKVRKFKPNVALVQNVFPLISPSVYVALKICGIPIVQRLFNYRLVCTNGVLFTENQICTRCVNGNYFHAVFKKCYRNSAIQSAAFAFCLWFWRSIGLWRWGVRRFITPDQFLATQVMGVIRDAKKIDWVPNPSAGNFKPNFANRDKTVLFVGRPVIEKGIVTFVQLAKKMPDLNFECVGAEASEIADVVNSHLPDNFSALGALYGSAMNQRLQSAGVIVIPSQWYDNVPLILSQAMLNGTPVVASDIDGIPEFIIPGQTGRLFFPTDVDQAEAAIRNVFAEPELTNQLAKNAAEFAAKTFSNQNFVAHLDAALLKAIS